MWADSYCEFEAVAGGAVPVVSRLPQYEELVREGEVAVPPSCDQAPVVRQQAATLRAREPQRLASLRRVFAGGAPVMPAVLDAIQAAAQLKVQWEEKPILPTTGNLWKQMREQDSAGKAMDRGVWWLH